MLMFEVNSTPATATGGTFCVPSIAHRRPVWNIIRSWRSDRQRRAGRGRHVDVTTRSGSPRERLGA